jgi:hypothetical protein
MLEMRKIEVAKIEKARRGEAERILRELAALEASARAEARLVGRPSSRSCGWIEGVCEKRQVTILWRNG